MRPPPRRMGRPPSAPETVRRNRVATLVTDAELEKLVEVAKTSEESLSAFVHRIVSNYLRRKRS